MARKSRKHIAEPIFTSVSPFINTALYIRLSVEDNKKRGNSIETQKMVLKDYLSNKPEFRIYDTYIDNGTTGTNFNREGFQRMLSDIEAGKNRLCNRKGSVSSWGVTPLTADIH